MWWDCRWSDFAPNSKPGVPDTARRSIAWPRIEFRRVTIEDMHDNPLVQR